VVVKDGITAQQVLGEGRQRTHQIPRAEIECHANRDDPPRLELGHRDRGNEDPERDDSE
jgi:hypothetical protein